MLCDGGDALRRVESFEICSLKFDAQTIAKSRIHCKPFATFVSGNALTKCYKYNDFGMNHCGLVVF